MIYSLSALTCKYSMMAKPIRTLQFFVSQMIQFWIIKKVNYLPSAVFIAQLLVGPNNQLRQIIQTKYNIVKNPNWQEANQLAIIYKCGRGFELGATEKQIQWSERDSNPGPPDCESDTLTTRPRISSINFQYYTADIEQSFNQIDISSICCFHRSFAPN